ncbi:uncharacterized protein BDW43DRAFT_29170 [Aspergillus alliaceus]|uniref:uncharacterized protein n=1 Tax=Petromyces alliaceus TaxID=209559 RepID=UPI0012A44A66|nr:uncharacterized protein BDW43DRAFT_29170 [Aspergillus alliaceus]KAB8226913.1 hypothetical protein BDW43DRAFT_29170 [Aspergillus alliaceus]
MESVRWPEYHGHPANPTFLFSIFFPLQGIVFGVCAVNLVIVEILRLMTPSVYSLKIAHYAAIRKNRIYLHIYIYIYPYIILEKTSPKPEDVTLEFLLPQTISTSPDWLPGTGCLGDIDELSTIFLRLPLFKSFVADSPILTELLSNPRCAASFQGFSFFRKILTIPLSPEFG